MRGWKQMLWALWAIVAMGGVTGCGSGDDGPAPLVVGMELAYPPFEMKDEQGKPKGVSVDLAEAMAKHLDRELVIRDFSWVGLVPALQSGQIDCVISSMTITEERDRSVDFTDPYLRSGICILAGAETGIDGLEDLEEDGRKLVVKLGTTGHQYALEFLPEAELAVLEDAGLCALEVAQGKADAFLYDQLSIYQYWRKHEVTTKALLRPLREEVWGIAVREGDDELREAINGFLESYREEGGFDRLGDRWLNEGKEGFEKLGVPFVF